MIERFLRLLAVVAIAPWLASCFQPLYGERSLAGGPGIKAALSQVEIAQIPAPNGTPQARVAVELRNQLLFGLNADAPLPPTHRLNIQLSMSQLSVSVDIRTSRPDVESALITVSYNLVDLNTGRTVLTDSTSARASYDIPGQEQRFSRQRALRDAENRAAGLIAESIRSRLASYFVAGT